MTRRLARPESLTLQLAASTDTTLEADTRARTITGLAVPYGPVGQSSMGAITFAQGSITVPENIGRIKLLRQHSSDVVLGFATKIEDRPDGLYTEFTVPDSPEGDTALLEAEDGRRDGLSIGVQLDEDTLAEIFQKWWDDDPEPTAARGELLEVSQVSIPAFSDARIDGSAALAHSGHITLSVDWGGATEARIAVPDKENDMTASMARASVAAEAASTDTAPEAPVQPAVAGSATEVAEAAVYTFNGQGASFIRDAYWARFEPASHPEAVERFARFNRMMAAGDRNQVRLLTAAVETRTTEPTLIQEGYRPDLMIAVIDKGRPLTGRIGTVTLTDATPYRIPVEGEFSGIADHVEGQAHAAEGDYVLDDVLVQPGAISGAYRLSRELIDASNPAIDSLALNAMIRDYRRVSEAKVNAALEAAAPASAAATTTVAGVGDAIDAYYDANTVQPDFAAVGSAFYSTLRDDVDGTGRPMLARVGSTNANGTILPGATGAEVDGVELVRAYSVDSAAAYLLAQDAVHIGESGPRTFRFEEVEGPGVIKLAIWAYFAAKVVRPAGVVRLATTDETP